MHLQDRIVGMIRFVMVLSRKRGYIRTGLSTGKSGSLDYPMFLQHFLPPLFHCLKLGKTTYGAIYYIINQLPQINAAYRGRILQEH